MPNPFVKGWKYLLASAEAKLDQHADPMVQIQQATEEVQRQHHLLTQQAAAVIGNQRQLELKLARQLSEVDKLKGSARQALLLADNARAAGNEGKADEYEQSARLFATELVALENSLEDLKALHEQAIRSAEQARQAVSNNALLVQQKLAERARLVSQLEQANLQEAVATSLESMSSAPAPGTTPTFDQVRDRIERRYATALGRAELAAGTIEGRSVQVRHSTLELDGGARLEQIRASLATRENPDEITGGEVRSS